MTAIQNPDQNINELFEKLYVKNAPSWALERDPDGSYKYHATQSAFLLFEQQQAEINELKAKASAVPEGFVLVKNVHPDAIVHNQGLGLFKECQIIYGWDGKSKDFKDALNKGFYHGVKLGAKAVLETAMIEEQGQKG